MGDLDCQKSSDMSAVNRSATATKVRVKDKFPVSSKSSDDVAKLKEISLLSGGTDGRADGDGKGEQRSKTNSVDSFKKLGKSRGTKSEANISVNLGTKKTRENDTPKLQAKKEAKSKALQSLIHKAGADEKLKDFKVDDAQMVANDSSKTSTKTTAEELSKCTTKKKPLNAECDVVNAERNTKRKGADAHDIQAKAATSKMKSQFSSVKRDHTKLSRPSTSSTNQKRKEILSGSSETPARDETTMKVCDPEVQSWLETLKLKDIDKYVAMFTEHEVNMNSAILLGRNDLREMGVSALGPLNVLCAAIETLNEKKEKEKKRQEKLKKVSKTKAQTKSLKSTEVVSEKSVEIKHQHSPLRKPENSTEHKSVQQGNVCEKPESKRGEVKFPGTDFSAKEAQAAEKKEAKKKAFRRPLSAVTPKQNSAAVDAKILRRPPSARQSMAMSIAHIGLPGEHNGAYFVC